MAPFGITGLETALGLALDRLLHAGHIGLTRLVELLAEHDRNRSMTVWAAALAGVDGSLLWSRPVSTVGDWRSLYLDAKPAVGDVNGNGVSDVAIGTPFKNEAGLEQRLRVLSGVDGSLLANFRICNWLSVFSIAHPIA